MTAKPTFSPYGDGAVLVQFETDGFSREVVDKIHTLRRQLLRFDIWEDLIPGYDSLLVTFNPVRLDTAVALSYIEAALENPPDPDALQGRVIDIPVCYGGAFGPDINTIMDTSGLSETGVIELHRSQTYLVCMMGFIPGFTFLSEAPKPLHHPRHDTPRLSVPAGSVGIAGWQTGMYGLESPGGWQIIGRTPVKLFDKDRDAPFHLSAGDSVRFVPIKHEDFDA